MKKLQTLILFSLLLSCSQKIENESTQQVPDTLILNSEKHLLTVDTLGKKADSITKDKVIKIVTEIKYLNKEVEKFKTEKLTLENKLKVVSEKIIYRIDTVFIETQKNFWGKKKTVTTVNSDSSILEKLDSSELSSEKIDTLNINQKNL
ncbi:MAG: hypothetical protein RL264_660 [Bacteroidota bacterium]|jgi:hypothetical protein